MMKENLTKQVPDFVSACSLMDEIYSAEGAALDELQNAIDDTFQQCIANSSSWGLEYWEQFLGIKTDLTKSDDERRSVVIAHLRGSGVVSKSMLKNVAESFQHGMVDIIENTSNYSFIVKFISEQGIPSNLDDLEAAIEDIKPAHLAVSYEFLFALWQAIEGKLWSDLQTKTWDDIRSGK